MVKEHFESSFEENDELAVVEPCQELEGEPIVPAEEDFDEETAEEEKEE